MQNWYDILVQMWYVDCYEKYFGESARHIGEGYKEHSKTPSPIYGHYTTNGHLTSVDNFSIVGREVHGFARTVK